MKAGILFTAAAILAATTGCIKGGHIIPNPGKDTIHYPDFAEAENPKVLGTANGVTIWNGGYGSSMAQDPTDKSVFYLMTDRGPNVAGVPANSIVIATPGFNPQIGKFRLSGNQLILEDVVTFKTDKGGAITGLPNPQNQGATGETAYDLNGNILPADPNGLDSEGFTLDQDGTFWVSDEYGPHIVHFNYDGRTIERVNPFGTGTGGRKIPLVFARRRPNRGMEGLTMTPDHKTLVGIMQSPMYNPSSADVANSLVLRVLTFDIASGKTHQYVYLLENATLQGVSEITAIDSKHFLALERDGNFPTDANRSTVFKRIYKFSIDGATDISDPANSAAGKMVNGLTIEQMKDAATLSANGITPVSKTLVADLMTDISSVYPHDKAEGMVIINNKLIAVSNDDDFGITGASGVYQAKILPETNTVDKNSIYFIKLTTPLY
jgi:hypothetical protein